MDAPIEDIPRNIVAITEQTLRNQMVGSTLDILRDWPGVQRGSDSPGGEHPRVRGMLAYQFLEGSYSVNRGGQWVKGKSYGVDGLGVQRQRVVAHAAAGTS
ncbi:MAG TPA: TonB-dependent receptor plug domain-containing protein [Steroidobacteraceae bacterium]|nr:TonB-dependent receptor plug domain-containing protein [Steroidobacteraceae bacterium]